MSERNGVSLLELARVVASGNVAYLTVDFFLLPQLARLGVSFSTYLYLGVLASGVLAAIISLLTRPRARQAAPEVDAEIDADFGAERKGLQEAA